MVGFGRGGKKKGKGLGFEPFGLSKTVRVSRFTSPTAVLTVQAQLKSWLAQGAGPDQNGGQVAVIGF